MWLTDGWERLHALRVSGDNKIRFLQGLTDAALGKRRNGAGCLGADLESADKPARQFMVVWTCNPNYAKASVEATIQILGLAV